MDAELIAIGRVRRAVRDLSDAAQIRVLQYVSQGLYEAENAKQRAEQERRGLVPPGYGSGALGGNAAQGATARPIN